MTDEALADNVGGEIDSNAKPKAKGLSGKKLVLFIVLPVLLLLAIGAGVFFSGLLDPVLGDGAAEEQGAEGEQAPALALPVYYDLPEMLVNLNSSGRAPAFLRLSVSLELKSDVDSSILEGVLPRIVDNFQVFLRELRVEDLSGSSGLQRLREELLTRANAAAQSEVFKDVLFKEMLVQ